MTYFDNPKHVEEYVKMAEGFDGRELIEILKTWLKPGATVLELGIGPGVDVELLSEHYQVTGSDYSQAFLDRYRQKNPDADLVLLNAVTMDVDRKFDGIYSNKVLHHLTRNDLKTSLHKQAEVLKDNGILFHSFWYGDTDEEMHGLLFTYYTKETLKQAIGNEYRILEMKQYTEMEDSDSLYLVLQKK
jgi:ubiquinone/menaquinone biosynthesis C-methylase UbiE